ncbi:MAG: carbonic anhydrase [Elusimicrobiota bacterium]|nr:carbonic anhydrase [Elusimicrobiota bacterium]
MIDTFLKTVVTTAEIPVNLKNTPFGRLLEYQNCGLPLPKCSSAELLVCMCMDNRKQLRLPDNFAYILRTGGGNIRQSEFKVSYAIGVGGVRHIALIAHDNCGMVNLASKRKAFISGLVENAGWRPRQAMDYFDANAQLYEIGSEIGFVLSEARRLNSLYPKVKVLPMFYKLSDGKLYLIKSGQAPQL